jgi:hypothetical protein
MMLYRRHVQPQTGCDRLLSVKTASDPYPFLSSYFALGKNIVKKTRHMMFVVKATYIESTGLPSSLVSRLGLHFIHQLLEVRRVLGEGQLQRIQEMLICHVGTLFTQ